MTANDDATVLLLPAGVSVRVLPGETIVSAARRLGYRMPYACRRGGCGACLAVLEEGDLTYQGPVAQSVLDEASAAHVGPGTPCLPCRAVPAGPVVIRLLPPVVSRFGTSRRPPAASPGSP